MKPGRAISIIICGSVVAGASPSIDRNNTTISSTFVSFTTQAEVVRRLKVRPVRFYAMGDTPYSDKDKAILPFQVENLDPSFDLGVHLGDIQAKASRCKSDSHEYIAEVLKKSKVPMFIVPGDNDYYDCDNRHEAFGYWNASLSGLQDHWSKRFNVRSQRVRPENFAVTWHRVLFIGIHTLWASEVKDKVEWNRLENQNLNWSKNQLKNFAYKGRVDAVVILAHSYTRPGLYPKYHSFLSDEAEKLGLPFLFLQGDAHTFKQDTPFRAKNILRTVVDRGGIADPMAVTVDLSKSNPFIFERRELSVAFDK